MQQYGRWNTYHKTEKYSWQPVALDLYACGNSKPHILSHTQMHSYFNDHIVCVNLQFLIMLFCSVYPMNRVEKDIDGIPMGVIGELSPLQNCILSTQPITGFDWCKDKRGLSVCSAFDQTIRVLITTKMNLYWTNTRLRNEECSYLATLRRFALLLNLSNLARIIWVWGIVFHLCVNIKSYLWSYLSVR